MDRYTVVHEDGTVEALPFVQFELSEKQQIMVIGSSFDTNKEIVTSDEHPGVEAQKIGTLEEQNAIFQIQIINSLKLHAWDFGMYPNPEIILITDKRA